MPVYNGEALLESSIRSILARWHRAICREFAAMDARIHYYRNPKNLGGSGNYNYVFSLARGKYFKWCAQQVRAHDQR